MTYKKALVIGAGRWGSAFAIYLQRQKLQVGLLCNSQSSYESIAHNLRSPHLPGYLFQPEIQPMLHWQLSGFSPDFLVIAVPSQYIAAVCRSLPHFSAEIPILSISKGIAYENLQTVPEIVCQHFPNNPYLHLGGPCFPQGLLGKTSIAAETLASKNIALGQKIQQLLSSDNFRVYLSEDVQGVAFLGALKNVLAIASGALQAIEVNEEVFALLVTRGIAEWKKMSVVYGFLPETIYGLSGLGDLIVTCYAQSSSHNRNFGRLVVEKGGVAPAIESLGPSIAEGYLTTKAIYQKNHQLQIESPIIDAVYSFLFEGKTVKELLQQLMNRPLKNE